MRRNAKPLKKNAGELEGILIGPLKAPRFSRCRNSVVVFFPRCTKVDVGFGSKFRGADGKPTTEPSQETRVTLDNWGPATVLVCWS